MEKVYLLLRKNQQTGPYTYEELLQQQLQATDLIWVDGKSTAWLNPAELKVFEANHAKAQMTRIDSGKRPRKAMPQQPANDEIPWYQKKKSPEAELEERALAIRERAASATNHSYRPSMPVTNGRYRKHTVYQEEESPVLLEVHTLHKKNISLPQLIAAGVITTLVAAGWYNRDKLNVVRPQPTEISQAAAPVTFQVTLPPAPTPMAAQVPDTVSAQTPDTILPASVSSSSMAVQQTKPKPIEAKETITQVPIEKPALVQTVTTEKKAEKVDDTTNTTAKVENKEAVDTALDQAVNATTIEQAVPHKKKGLGQAIKNIFKKKKKDNESEDAEKASVD